MGATLDGTFGVEIAAGREPSTSQGASAGGSFLDSGRTQQRRGSARLTRSNHRCYPPGKLRHRRPRVISSLPRDRAAFARRISYVGRVNRPTEVSNGRARFSGRRTPAHGRDQQHPSRIPSSTSFGSHFDEYLDVANGDSRPRRSV
jgi:hypothetical protein